MTQYSNSPGAERLARHSVDLAIVDYQKTNNTEGLGNSYYAYGKIYKIFGRDSASLQKSAGEQLKAISYYGKTNYNPGLAVAYMELASVYYLENKVPDACSQKYEAMKSTHPKDGIPMHNPKFPDFGSFVTAARQDMKCA